ncbi:Lrp/AsnC family transcriptional regulator [Jiangella anatolica]|uniref:AsnC family transcriptional regulator n=1 Tax=Jiangella anatolica TaxID=2670374 RepID=A0A2W2AZA7_9ACTN|nr:Lrp/AsnC family transcriptional regulator [Jiangella anatolica]PZF80535.1 AsnC family transcriptional regulator [Jiangella anatolica]
MADESKNLQKAAGLSAAEVRLLRALADDARTTNAALASAADMPASTCLQRVQSLRRREVVRGFHTDIDRRALGLDLEVLVAVELDEQDPAHSRRFVDICRSLEHVMAVLLVSGQHHFQLQVQVANTEDLLAQVIRPLEALPFVRRTDTSIVFGHWRRHSPLGAMTRT